MANIIELRRASYPLRHEVGERVASPCEPGEVASRSNHLTLPTLSCFACIRMTALGPSLSPARGGEGMIIGGALAGSRAWIAVPHS
jgi:hypothetical protein